MLFLYFQTADELYNACRFVPLISLIAHKIVSRSRFVHVLDCAQILVVHTSSDILWGVSDYPYFVGGVRILWGVSVFCGGYPYFVGGIRLSVFCGGYPTIRILWGVSVFCGGYPYFVGGVRILWGVSVFCGGCTYFVGGIRILWGVSVFCGGTRIFSGKICINPYHSNIPHAKHRNYARNIVLLFITGTHK